LLGVASSWLPVDLWEFFMHLRSSLSLDTLNVELDVESPVDSPTLLAGIYLVEPWVVLKEFRVVWELGFPFFPHVVPCTNPII
jgi:hypothetical protein